MALAGQIKAYTRVKKMGENRPTAVLKMATEAIYLALKLRWVCLFPSEIPPMDIGALIGKICDGDEATKDWIFKLVESRKADKNGEYTKSEEYIWFIADSEALSEQVKGSQESKKDNAKNNEEMQKKADELFLQAIGFQMSS